MPTTTPRPFVWYELLTPDPEAAKSFYTRLFGWGTEPFNPGEPQVYEMWKNGGTAFGGLMRMPAEAQAPPHWLGYVGVEDVDAVAERVKAKGGNVHVEPRDIPNAGRFAVLADPAGAAFAVHQTQQSDWTPPELAPGFVSWHELATDDYRAAFDFYADLFGWRVDNDMDMGPELGVYRMFQTDKPVMAGGIYNRQPDMPPPGWLFYTLVDDLDAKVAKAQELGGKLLNGPMEVPGGDRIAQLADPQGAMFAMHEKKKG